MNEVIFGIITPLFLIAFFYVVFRYLGYTLPKKKYSLLILSILLLSSFVYFINAVMTRHIPFIILFGILIPAVLWKIYKGEELKIK